MSTWTTLVVMAVLSTSAVSVTSASPVRRNRRAPVTTGHWLTGPQARGSAGRSHLMMWMMTEKQLVPRVEALAESALQLMTFVCEQQGVMGGDACLDHAASLPGGGDLSSVNHVPSQTVLKSEKKKQFIKMLMENAYRSLVELQPLLERHVFTADPEAQCEALNDSTACHQLEHFRRGLTAALTQYRDMVTVFYKTKPLKAPAEVSDGVEDVDDMALKVLYVAYGRLSEISAVLQYSVELSWFSRQQESGKGGGGGKKRNKKNKRGNKKDKKDKKDKKSEDV